jgi:hypothetical protein
LQSAFALTHCRSGKSKVTEPSSQRKLGSSAFGDLQVAGSQLSLG